MKAAHWHWFALAVCFSGPAFAEDGPLQIQDPASFEAGSPISELDRLECTPAHRLSKAILDSMRPLGVQADSYLSPSRPEAGWVLDVTVENLNGVGSDRPGAKAWNGRWSMRVRSSLYWNGKIVTFTTMQRSTIVGQTGSCTDGIARVANALGADIARWASAQIRAESLLKN